jgi:hypothetical protein
MHCSDIFDSVDTECGTCFKNFYKTNAECINYTIETIPETRVIRDANLQIVNNEEFLNVQRRYLIDYILDDGTVQFLNPLIKRGCKHKCTFDRLFNQLFINCNEENCHQYVRYVSKAIISALRNGWYTPAESNSKYILKIVSRKRMFGNQNLDKYKTLIYELLECGEIILEEDREKIYSYLYCNCPPHHELYVKEIVDNLFEICNEYSSFKIKSPGIE